MSLHPPFNRLSSALFSVVAATVVLTAAGTLATIATGTVPAALAQDQGSAPPAGPGQGAHRMGKILMGLNLSDAQKNQIRGIMADAHKQNHDVTDRATRRANMQAAYAKIDPVLTPEQRTEFHAKLDAMRQQNAAAPAH